MTNDAHLLGLLGLFPLSRLLWLRLLLWLPLEQLDPKLHSPTHRARSTGVKRQSCKPTNKQASKKCLVAYPLPLTLWSVTAARRPSDGGGGGNSPGCSSLVRMVILPCTMLVETVWAAALAAAASCRARCSRTFLPPRFVFFFLTAPPSP